MRINWDPCNLICASFKLVQDYMEIFRVELTIVNPSRLHCLKPPCANTKCLQGLNLSLELGILSFFLGDSLRKAVRICKHLLHNSVVLLISLPARFGWLGSVLHVGVQQEHFAAEDKKGSPPLSFFVVYTFHSLLCILITDVSYVCGQVTLFTCHLIYWRLVLPTFQFCLDPLYVRVHLRNTLFFLF